MKGLGEALRFLSILPVPGKPPLRNARTLEAYPFAGLIIGMITAGSAYAASWMLGFAGTAVVAVAVRIILTGGLHLDGLADLFDGLGGGRSPQTRLNIMSDSRIGTFGVLSLLVVTALQVVFIAALVEILSLSFRESSTTFQAGMALKGLPLSALLPFLTTPAISRGGGVLVMRLHRAARKTGMGKEFREMMGTGTAVLVVFYSFLISGLFLGIAGIAVAVIVIGIMTVGSFFIVRKLEGITGDVCGALIECGETLALGCFLFFLQIGLSFRGLPALFYA